MIDSNTERLSSTNYMSATAGSPPPSHSKKLKLLALELTRSILWTGLLHL